MNFYKRIMLVCICCGIYMFAFTQVEKQGQHDTTGVTALLNSLNNNTNDTSLVLIADISVHGNKKTKPFIIEREIPFTQGDYISFNELQKKLILAHDQIMNTALFTQVSVYIESRQGELAFINVDVKERWYLFP